MRNHRTTLAVIQSEDGFTLVEIVIATAVILIAAVGLLGLSVMTTTVGNASKARSVATAEAGSYIEGLRALPYDQIGVVGGANGSIVGTMPATTTVARNGYSITLVPTITWVDDSNILGLQNYKKVNLDVTARFGGAASVKYHAETLVREDKDQSMPANAVPPVIAFGAGSPAELDVVSGTSVRVDGAASTNMAGAVLLNMRFYCGATELRSASGAVAEWAPGTASAAEAFDWDTTKLNENGIQFWPDGVYLLKVMVWDSLGQPSFRTRQVLVDNAPPSAPTSMTVVSNTATAATISWPAARDGANEADHYMAYFYKQDPTSGAWPTTTDSQFNNLKALTGIKTTTAFSRYKMQLQAHSPDPLNRLSLWYYYPSAWISRPKASGTYKATTVTTGNSKKYQMDASISVTPPNFPCTSIRYDVYRSLSSGNMGASPWKSDIGGPLVTDAVIKLGNNQNPATSPDSRYYYQFVVTVVPSDSPTSPPEVVKSNIVGPTDQAGSGTGTTYTMGDLW